MAERGPEPPFHHVRCALTPRSSKVSDPLRILGPCPRKHVEGVAMPRKSWTDLELDQALASFFAHTTSLTTRSWNGTAARGGDTVSQAAAAG